MFRVFLHTLFISINVDKHVLKITIKLLQVVKNALIIVSTARVIRSVNNVSLGSITIKGSVLLTALLGILKTQILAYHAIQLAYSAIMINNVLAALKDSTFRIIPAI